MQHYHIATQNQNQSLNDMGQVATQALNWGMGVSAFIIGGLAVISIIAYFFDKIGN
jgi:hypothetical protein